MIKKIATLKGHVDCPFCFSYLEWDNIEDIKVSNGTEYVVCPQCNKNIILDSKKDYWSSEAESSEGSSNNGIFRIAVEQGIQFPEDKYRYEYAQLDKTWNEVKTALDKGMLPVIIWDENTDNVQSTCLEVISKVEIFNDEEGNHFNVIVYNYDDGQDLIFSNLSPDEKLIFRSTE